MADEDKYYVRVCRPRFEVATLEITCKDHDEAELLARLEASELPRKRWKLLPYDEANYAPHVEECWSDNDMDANADAQNPKESLIREFMSLEDDRDQLYLFLLADPTSGEGDVIFEPWCNSDDPELLEFDLSGDWIGTLSSVFKQERLGPNPSKNGKH